MVNSMFGRIKQGRSGGATTTSNNTLFINVANVRKNDPHTYPEKITYSITLT